MPGITLGTWIRVLMRLDRDSELRGGGGATGTCPGSSSMAAGRGGLQLEEPSSRRAGLAGGEARRAQERRPRGRRAGRRPPAARRTGAPAARHTGAPALGGGSSEGRAGLPGTTGRARWRGKVGGGDGRGAEDVARREGAGPRPRGSPRAGAPAARPQGRAPAPGGGSLEGRAGLTGTTGRAR